MSTKLEFYARIGGSRVEVLSADFNGAYDRHIEARYLITGGRRKLSVGSGYTSSMSVDAVILRAMEVAREWYPKAKMTVTVCARCRREKYVRRGYLDLGPANPAAGDHCKHVHPPKAWTGGGDPRTWAHLSAVSTGWSAYCMEARAERAYALQMYRDAIEAFRNTWETFPDRDTLAMFFRRARMDAHATYRS